MSRCLQLVENKRKEDDARHLKAFDEQPGLEVMNGKYGIYLAYNGKNYRLPKALQNKAAELTAAECMEVIENQDAKKKQ